jgi:hypothetical protein
MDRGHEPNQIRLALASQPARSPPFRIYSFRRARVYSSIHRNLLFTWTDLTPTPSGTVQLALTNSTGFYRVRARLP